MTPDLRCEQFTGNPVEVISGAGALTQVFAYAQRLGSRKILVVCGRNVGQLPAVTGLADAPPAGSEVHFFDRVEPDPSDHTVVVGGEQARVAGAEVIVAVGGGSSMDAGKAIAAEAAQPGWIFTQDHPGQPTTMPGTVLPIIAVPTTAGTASEVLPFAVITFTATQRKLVLNHDALYPKYALLDPTLLTSTPPPAQIAAGMDALAHAIESYVSKPATPQTQERALAAITLIARHLRAAVQDPQDLAAQSAMQRGAMTAGLAFAVTRLGIGHAMALPLSALFGVPHGVANAILLPFAMEFNRPAAAPQFANIAHAMGVVSDDETAEVASERAVVAVRELAGDVSAPQKMREAGVDEAAIERMAEDAMKSPHISRNPRTVTVADIIAIYQRAY